MGLEPITSAQLQDAADILRRLWKGEMILGHDGPSGAIRTSIRTPTSTRTSP